MPRGHREGKWPPPGPQHGVSLRKPVRLTALLRQVPLTHWARGSQDRQARYFPSRDARGERRVRTGPGSRPAFVTSPGNGRGSRRVPPPLDFGLPPRTPTLALCPLPAPGPHHRCSRLARSGSSAHVAAVPGAPEEAEGGAGPARRGRGARLL